MKTVTQPYLFFLFILVLCGAFCAAAYARDSAALNTNVSLFISEDSIILPVVVHVVHTGTPIGSPDNPSDSLIHEMIDLMNTAFKKEGPFYGGADMEIAFQLANRGPDCESTSGINRVDGSGVPKYVTGGITADTNFFPNSAHERFVKSLSRWPNTDYINIWIVHLIDSNDTWPGGYAYFPEYNSALIDGIVLRASVVNGSNKTVIHELGHYFSLYHVYEDEDWNTQCSANTDCSLDGDRICDTEPCLFTTNCAEPLNACTDDDWLVVDSEFDYTVLNNYMGFTDCQWMFTEDQKERVHAALETYRPGLLSSEAIQSEEESSPSIACMPTALNTLSLYYGIERVEFGTLNVYSNTSSADGSHYVDRTCNQRVYVMAGESVILRVTGSYENPQQIRAYIDYDNSGIFDPGELILSGDAGVAEDTIIIPLLADLLCTPLRIRIISENPFAPEPMSCELAGTLQEGVGQIEDFTIIIKVRQVYSISPGDWDDPLIWSCNCIPGEADFVTITSGHMIEVIPGLEIDCQEVNIEPGAMLEVNGQLRIGGSCPD